MSDAKTKTDPERIAAIRLGGPEHIGRGDVEFLLDRLAAVERELASTEIRRSNAAEAYIQKANELDQAQAALAAMTREREELRTQMQRIEQDTGRILAPAEVAALLAERQPPQEGTDDRRRHDDGSDTAVRDLVDVSSTAEVARAARPQEPPRCQGCGGPHLFDTSVPSVRWNAVIRSNGLPEYLCMSYILLAFARAGESFTAQLWGDDFNGLPVSITIGGKPLMDVVLINEENTRLRARIRELEAATPPAPPEAKADD